MAKHTFESIGTDNLTMSLISAIDGDVVRRWKDRFEAISYDIFPRALQWSLMQVAKEAQDYLADEVVDEFRSPVSFTQVRSGTNDLKRTSVRRYSKRLPRGKIRLDEVETQIYVMRKQSAYFKFALGERIRRPGDIGLAQEYIGIPIWAKLIDFMSINPTREGNLPSSAMEQIGRLKSEKTMSKQQRLDHNMGRRMTTFFGKPSKNGQLGWYTRPFSQWARTGDVIESGPRKGLRKMERKSDSRPHLLIAAHDQAVYKPGLTPGWNRAITLAADDLHAHLSAEFDSALMHASRTRSPDFQGLAAP